MLSSDKEEWVKMIKRLTTQLVKPDLRKAFVSATTMPARLESTSGQQSGSVVEPLRLPVPSLEQTLSKFLKSVRPLLNNKEYDATLREIAKFSQQEGPKLQRLLEARAQSTPNWLEEWWLNTAYLEYRDPLVLFSSPALGWPHITFSSEEDQLQCTATIISGALSFNSVLNRRALPQEMSGKSPLDMNQYYKVFGTSRIPLCLRDKLQFQDPVSPSRNIIVMYNNNAYSLTVLDGNHNPLSTGVILSMLQHVTRDGQNPGVPVGLLTSENRDRWARSYALLLRNITNVESLAEIDRALFVVCLDKPLPSKEARNQASLTSKLLLHGSGHAEGNAANRWFDKTVQFIVGAGSDGMGISLEHSPAEGGPIGVLADFVLDRLKTRVRVEPISDFPAPRKLNFELVPDVEQAIVQAGANIDKLAADLDVNCFKFDSFGKNHLKALKTSPDSFIQIAIQYAFYKVHGQPAAQYESGTLRKYKGGRTDVIRTCSIEALAFCSARGSPRDRASALSEALNAHKAYANDAISARGVDRHLLGLKLIAKENGLRIPQLFSDAGYVKSTHFQLSTSNVPARNDVQMIYAPLVDDGYACCYNPRDEDINFGTSAWKHSPVTDVTKFQDALTNALLDMKDVLSAAQAQKAKL